MRTNHRGQVTAELAVMLTFVIAGFVFMGFYLQRGVQGSTKSNADSLGQQFSTQSGWSNYSGSKSLETDAQSNTSSCSEYNHAVSDAGGDVPADATDCSTRLLDPSTLVAETPP